MKVVSYKFVYLQIKTKLILRENGIKYFFSSITNFSHTLILKCVICFRATAYVLFAFHTTDVVFSFLRHLRTYSTNTDYVFGIENLLEFYRVYTTALPITVAARSKA
jgi:hypothetical protein